jgi:hypothetical protein
MERTYYNLRQSSILSTSPDASGTPIVSGTPIASGTPMSLSPIPTVAETFARTASPTYSPKPTLGYPPDRRASSPDPLPNYIVISLDDELEIKEEDEPKSALVSDLKKLLKKEKPEQSGNIQRSLDNLFSEA